MLDLGAGPGTAVWAAALQFPELTHATLVEDAPEWISLGTRLAQSSEASALRTADWRPQSVTAELPAGTFDVVTISYALNELRPAEVTQVVRAAWERTAKVLLIAEPGTPAGFELIREVRRELIASGAFVAAPCPHALACPMRDGNWCHFAERVQRTSEHRVAKHAELGYEDEKYSYVVFCRQPVQRPEARILRHPQKHSGHVELELCTVNGLSEETVSRRQAERYKRARKAEWGDEF
jgi:ribosomal protein RSM22 (predicted rRNA methylase)